MGRLIRILLRPGGENKSRHRSSFSWSQENPASTPAYPAESYSPLFPLHPEDWSPSQLRLPRSGYGIPSIAALPVILFGSAQVKETDPEKSKNLFSQPTSLPSDKRGSQALLLQGSKLCSQQLLLSEEIQASFHDTTKTNFSVMTHSNSSDSLECAASHNLFSTQALLRRKQRGKVVGCKRALSL